MVSVPLVDLAAAAKGEGSDATYPWDLWGVQTIIFGDNSKGCGSRDYPGATVGTNCDTYTVTAVRVLDLIPDTQESKINGRQLCTLSRQRRSGGIDMSTNLRSYTLADSPSDDTAQTTSQPPLPTIRDITRAILPACSSVRPMASVLCPNDAVIFAVGEQGFLARQHPRFLLARTSLIANPNPHHHKRTRTPLSPHSHTHTHHRTLTHSSPPPGPWDGLRHRATPNDMGRAGGR